MSKQARGAARSLAVENKFRIFNERYFAGKLPSCKVYFRQFLGVGANESYNVGYVSGECCPAAIGSSSGEELASIEKPSTPVLVGNDANLRKKYATAVAQAIDAFIPSEAALGRVNRVVTTFDKITCVIIPHLSEEAFVVALVTRDSESNKIAFQILKLIPNFSDVIACFSKRSLL